MDGWLIGYPSYLFSKGKTGEQRYAKIPPLALGMTIGLGWNPAPTDTLQIVGMDDSVHPQRRRNFGKEITG